MEYLIVDDHDKRRFEDNVNVYLDCGWRLYGGVSITSYRGDLYFSQALVFYNTSSKG